MICFKMSRPEVKWCYENSSQFLVVNQDLSLCKVEKCQSSEQLKGSGISLPLSESTVATVVARSPISVQLSCWDWQSDRRLMAVGESNGKVTLLSPHPELTEPLLGREFTPRHSRICRDVKWCPNKSFDHMLAAAYEKYHRSDPAILIWDALHGPLSSSQDSDQSARKIVNRQTQSDQAVLSQNRPVQELGGGESGFSLAWFPQDRTLAAGLSNKYIRIYDTRGDYSSRAPHTIYTKAVMGLRLNPFDETKLLSYYENFVVVFDLRSKHEKPLVSVTGGLQQKVLQAEWDPIRKNVFSCLFSACPFVKLYHLQKMSGDDSELSYVERHVLPKFEGPTTPYEKVLSGFSWHPNQEAQMLAVSVSGLLSNTKVTERMCLDWNSYDGLVATFGPTVAQCTTFKDLNLASDISHQMHWRATAGYGLNTTESGVGTATLKHNVEILENEKHSRLPSELKEMLCWTWTWMERVKNLSAECAEDWNYPFRYCGVIAVRETKCNGDSESKREEVPIEGLESDGRNIHHQVYTSRQRSRILRLCGWGVLSGEGPTIDHRLKEIIAHGSFTRAAAIAMFCLKLQQAVQLLMKAAAAQPDMAHLQLVAMALAGYKGASEGGQSSLWQQLCSSLLPTVKDAYLRAIFLFLSERLEPDGNYGSLMALKELPLYDRVAFAAIHFADHPLEEIYSTLAQQAVKNGDLFGLLLTGIHTQEKCMQLLQNFVDRTGDVQSAALMLIHSGCIPCRASIGRVPSRSSFGTSRYAVAEEVADVPGWQIVESYFLLLNSWQLWHTRAHTEALISQKQNPESQAKLRSQVSVICTFCNKTIFTTTGRHRGRGPLKSGACPNPVCKKPLPRCVLCRRHMGLPLPKEQEKTDSKERKFDSWFSWCQSCRHGGHAIHMKDWFRENSECPVTGCACKCAQLDTTEVSK